MIRVPAQCAVELITLGPLLFHTLLRETSPECTFKVLLLPSPALPCRAGALLLLAVKVKSSCIQLHGYGLTTSIGPLVSTLLQSNPCPEATTVQLNVTAVQLTQNKPWRHWCISMKVASLVRTHSRFVSCCYRCLCSCYSLSSESAEIHS
jgi:hypothetical protein